MKKTLTYEDIDFESARYNTFYHSMLYVYRDYSSAYSNDDTYQQANNIQLDEVYDFSDHNKITQVTPDDKVIAVSTANNIFHYDLTNYNGMAIYPFSLSVIIEFEKTVLADLWVISFPSTVVSISFS